MKKDTKNLIVVAGIAAAGLYVVSTMGGEGDGWGGGGGGGIPLLPGDTEGTAEGDTVINYVLPKPEEFGGWEDDTWDLIDPGPEPDTKKPVVEPTFDFGGATREPSPTAGFGGGWGVGDESVASQLDDRTLSQQAGGTIRGGLVEAIKLSVIGTGGGIDFLTSIAGIDMGFEKNAREGVKDWFAPTGQVDTTVADPSKKAGASSVGGISRTVRTDRVAEKTQITRLKRSEYDSFGSGGHTFSGGYNGFSRMSDQAKASGVRPGWKQVGAKKPTAPGQPDRY